MAGTRAVSNIRWLAGAALMLATSLTLAGQTHIVDRVFPPAEVTPQADRRSVSLKGPAEDFMRSGYDAYKKTDFRKCLADYQQASDYNLKQSPAYGPTEATAQNMIGNCAKESADYPTAITAFKKALELDPIKYYNMLGLASSYSLAGMKDELKAELDEMDNLKALGLIRPQSLYFVSDSFSVGVKSVRVSRWYPRCEGCGDTFTFDVSDDTGRFLFRAWYGFYTITEVISLKEALESERRLCLYVLNDSTQGPQKRGLYKLYGSEQLYESLRHDVQDLIDEKLGPVQNKALWFPQASGDIYEFTPAPGLEPVK